MQEKETTKFVEWINSLTIADTINIFLMIAFTLMITILVVRTFKNKPSA